MAGRDYRALKNVSEPGIAAVWDSLAATCDARYLHWRKRSFRIRPATPLERMTHDIGDDETILVMIANKDPLTLVRWAVPTSWIRLLPRWNGEPELRALFGKVLAAERAVTEITSWKSIGHGAFFSRSLS